MKKKLSTLLILSISCFVFTPKAEAAYMDPAYYTIANYYPTSVHIINSISLDIDSVEFTDGSKWSVPSSEYFTVLNWRPGDYVLVTQNNWFFSFYYYELQNLSKNTSSLANLTLWPIRHSPYAHMIKNINYQTKQLILEDDSFWDISSSHAYIFNEWRIGDLIIIGNNANHYHTSYKHILINTNQSLKQFVRAKLN